MSPYLARILRITARHWSLPRREAVPAGARSAGAPLRVVPVAAAQCGCQPLCDAV
jgi:hypothetical protein